jgi:hypothetical protein
MSLSLTEWNDLPDSGSIPRRNIPVATMRIESPYLNEVSFPGLGIRMDVYISPTEGGLYQAVGVNQGGEKKNLGVTGISMQHAKELILDFAQKHERDLQQLHLRGVFPEADGSCTLYYGEPLVTGNYDYRVDATGDVKEEYRYRNVRDSEV